MTGTTGGRTAKTVHQAISAVSRDVQAVGKSGRNEEDGYSFRTIDDVMTALNPALAKHGVHVAPKVLTHHAMEWRSARLVELEVRFRIYGPAGDHVDVTTWGEGLDASDKATSKAHTAALKNALLPAFMIPTANLVVDGDASSPAAPDAAHRRIVAAEEARPVDKLDGDVEARRNDRRAASIRAEVLAVADELGAGSELVRLEQLEEIRSRAVDLGVIGWVVELPKPWQHGVVTRSTIDELIEGAKVVGLPWSGETERIVAADPWDVDPATRAEATS